jgi:peptidoglycan/xylan/chitin deacetylase (PgdA/CDA1 family)
MSRSALLLILLLANLPVQAASHCVILQYHHFSDDTPAITSVTLEQFDDHLDYLKHNNFNVLPLRDVVMALKNKQELPDRCISLSVDDAYISVYQNAAPRLKKLGWPLTVFVNTEGVDQGISSYMTWDQMRELSKQGVTFENHGHGHIHMIRKNPDESEEDWRLRVVNDISTAQQRITSEIGIAPQLFAHPYGEYNPVTLEIVNEMGLTGFGQQSGPAWPGADFAVLPRFPMAANYAGMKSFKVKVDTLPLPIVLAEPADPLVPPGQKRPGLELTLMANAYSRAAIQCYIGGSNNVEIVWSKDRPDQLKVTPGFDLGPGRHRTNCTMPSAQKGRFHWYSHNWFVRKSDGSWYSEY